MEVVAPVPAMEFQFDSACSTPYVSAPSSPRRAFGNFYFSAPTSPNRASAIYSQFNSNQSQSAVVPFLWEDIPGKPKPSHGDHDDGEDFEFEFSGRFADPEKPPLLQSTADELFYKGKIRPLKPPPRLQLAGDEEDNQYSSNNNKKSPNSSPRSPIAQGKKMIRDALSPRSRPKRDFDPFIAAMEETTKEERGRERAGSTSSGNNRRTRSLSPLRILDFVWEEQQLSSNQNQSNPKSSSTTNPAVSVTPKPSKSSSSSSSTSSSSRKWKLKDFLFRSASEGRAHGKDPLRKLKNMDDAKNSSFRSTDSCGSSTGSRNGKKAPVSPHELLYTANRAVTEEMRKKTFLPYKQGLLGCLGFSPIATNKVGGFARGFNSPHFTP